MNQFPSEHNQNLCALSKFKIPYRLPRQVEAKINVGQGQHAPPPPPPPKPKLLDDGSSNMDTASRRSISQKRSMFEGDGEDETVESVDPAMLSMSQRRALFEKNRTAPKPVARFGDAVTPSMLNK